MKVLDKVAATVKREPVLVRGIVLGVLAALGLAGDGTVNDIVIFVFLALGGVDIRNRVTPV